MAINLFDVVVLLRHCHFVTLLVVTLVVRHFLSCGGGHDAYFDCLEVGRMVYGSKRTWLGSVTSAMVHLLLRATISFMPRVLQTTLCLLMDYPRTLYGPCAFAGRLSSGRVCVRQLFVLRSFVVRSLPVGRSSCVGSCGVRARRLTG